MNITTSTVITTLLTNSTHVPDSVVPNYVGYLALSVSVVFLGSNYLPVKQYETGDGMFFQLILTTAIWTVGFGVYCIRGYPTFYALPMLGGFFWSTGNLTVVPIIKLVGIGMGALFWNTILLIIGWTVARFGLFGVHAEVPSNTTLNYIGVVFSIISGVFYLFVTSETNSTDEQQQSLIIESNQGFSSDINSDANIVNVLTTRTAQPSYIETLSANKRRLIGLTLAAISGVLYGITFTPALYVQDNYDKASQNALDYVFSLYTGIYCTSITYFAIYCVVKKNKPIVYANIILPALVSGWVWGCGNSLFFLANNALTQAVTFPIVSSAPPAISTLWGIFLYKEIKGGRNFLILAFGFACTVAGSILCGISAKK